MKRYKFAACEYSFPIWGSLAMEMASEAGFEGIEITDGGGYLQPHPLNNGYVEYERLGLDLRRQDSFPLTDPFVQEDYLEAAAKYKLQITGIKLHLLENQGFIKESKRTPQGKEGFETIKNGILAASQMKIPAVIISARGLFGLFQQGYAYEKLLYAAETGAEYGVAIFVALDTPAEKQIGIVDSLDRGIKLDFHTIAPELCAAGNPAEMITRLGKERIGQFRVKDLLADSEGFLTSETAGHALLGQGDSKFGACAQAIKDSGYTGWIVADTAYYSEAVNSVCGDYITAAAKDAATLKRIFTDA